MTLPEQAGRDLRKLSIQLSIVNNEDSIENLLEKMEISCKDNNEQFKDLYTILQEISKNENFIIINDYLYNKNIIKRR